MWYSVTSFYAKVPSEKFTAGAWDTAGNTTYATTLTTIREGDVLVLNAAGAATVKPVANNATSILGWALNDAAVGEEVDVLLAYPGVQVEMDFIGTYVAANELWSLRACDLTGSVYSCDMDEEGNDAFKVIRVTYNETAATLLSAARKRCIVEVIPSASQAMLGRA